MKIHAIYTLLTATFVAVLPSQSPETGVIPGNRVEVADRPMENFSTDPVPLAWETGLTVENDEASLEAVDQTITMADDDETAGGFAAFGPLGTEATTEVAADSGMGGNEWDMANALEQKATEALSSLEGSSTVQGILAEAADRLSEAEEAPLEFVLPDSNIASVESVVPGQDGASNLVVDDISTPAPVATGLPTNESAPAEPAGQAIVSDEEGFWIRGAKLNDVFQYLARLGDLQYFHNADLDAPNYVVTGHLRDGDPEKQMDELGLMYGITIHRKGSTVYAMTSAQLSQLPTKPYQYNLRYLRPTDIEQIKTILGTMLTPGSGIVEYEPKTNTLIIIDNEQKVEVIREILADMDKPKKQIVIETRILRVNTSSSNKIGVDWTSVLGDGLTIDAEESLNALFGLPDSDTVSEVVSLTNNLASGSSNAFNGESSYDITDGGNLLNGALEGDTTGSFSNSERGTTSTDSFTSSDSNRSFTRSQSVDITGSNLVLSPLQLSATLRALNAGGLAQQESSPTLITEDNEQALISIVDRVPIIISTISETDAGQNISEEVRYRIDPDDPTISEDPTKTREIGVSVAVTPTILPDNTIRMALRPRSAQITDTVIGRSGNAFPRVNESSVDTIARIPNGNSLLIGGFYEETEGSTENKVPILGDIPGLRFFFSSSEKTKSNTSLIFVVTPKLYEPTSTMETLNTSRDLHTRHVVPSNHASPDRHNPGDSYEPNLGWTAGNLVNAYEPFPPTNPLHPEHPINQPEGTYDAYREDNTFAPQNSPAPPAPTKRRGLLHRLFNRDGKR